jgi:hypothetical protein
VLQMPAEPREDGVPTTTAKRGCRLASVASRPDFELVSRSGCSERSSDSSRLTFACGPSIPVARYSGSGSAREVSCHA